MEGVGTQTCKQSTGGRAVGKAGRCEVGQLVWGTIPVQCDAKQRGRSDAWCTEQEMRQPWYRLRKGKGMCMGIGIGKRTCMIRGQTCMIPANQKETVYIAVHRDD